MFWLEEAGLPMTGANIARAMQLSPPTVHEMVGRLIDDGYVERNADKSLAFTESGREHASHIVRRHRMIERFLTDVLGIPWDEVHEEAERIEHAMSPVLEERMRAAIGDATTCPHGHPIVEGVRETGSLLADVEVGAKVHVLRFENEAEELLHYLKAAGLEPGLEGTLESSDEDGRDNRLRRRLAPGLAQRRRDGLGPRRPGAAAAGSDPRAARAVSRPLRPLSSAAYCGIATETIGLRGRVVAAAARLRGHHHRVDALHVVDHRRRRAVAVGDEQRLRRFDPLAALNPGLEDLVWRAAGRRWRAAACRCRPSRTIFAVTPGAWPAATVVARAARAGVADRVAGHAATKSASTASPTAGRRPRARILPPAADSRSLRGAGVGLDFAHDPRAQLAPAARPSPPTRAASAPPGRSHSSSVRHSSQPARCCSIVRRLARLQRPQAGRRQSRRAASRALSRSCQALRESSPDLLQAEPHPPLDGAQRHPDHRGDLRLTEAAEVGELDHLRLLAGQLAEAPRTSRAVSRRSASASVSSSAGRCSSTASSSKPSFGARLERLRSRSIARLRTIPSVQERTLPRARS